MPLNLVGRKGWKAGKKEVNLGGKTLTPHFPTLGHRGACLGAEAVNKLLNHFYYFT